MDATTRVVRIYYSTSQYRSQAQPTPTPEPLEAHDFPTDGDTLRVWFGPVPDPIAHDLQVLVAVANTRLNLITGNVSDGGDEVIAAELEKVQREDQVSLNELWYVTLCVDRPVVLGDVELTGNQYQWIAMSGEIEASEDVLRRDAAGAIDLAVAAVSPLLASNSLVSERILGRSYLLADGHEPTSYPRFSGSATGIGVHDPDSFPIEGIGARITALGERRDDWARLVHAAHWYEAMRREHEDDLKRFLWGFVALETLTNVLYADLYDLAVANLAMSSSDGTDAPHDIVLDALVRRKQRLSLAERFAVVASYLSSATASEDVATFRTVKQARDAIAHGLDRLDALSFPTSELERLLPRYLELSFEL